MTQKQKVAIIVHDVMRVRGGGERVVADVASTLCDAGYRVFVVADTDGHSIDSLGKFGNVKFKVVPWRDIPFGLAHLFSISYGLALRARHRGSIMIDTLGLILGPAIADVTYVHYPSLVTRQAWHAPRRVLALGLLAIGELSTAIHKRRQVLLFNSQWCLRTSFSGTRLYHKLSPTEPQVVVLYPPVDTEPLISLDSDERKDKVVTISRFASNKGLEGIGRLAGDLPNVQFVLAGRITDPEYFNALGKIIEAKSLESRVSLLPNITEDQKLALLSGSKVQVHFALHEHFGIALVEGLAAGLTVITRDFGGAPEFIPRKYLYSDESELPRMVTNALREWNQEVARHNREIAMRFSDSEFRLKFADIIGKVRS
jgi:glycosyltransferase involved in cell wall biosynthesis